MKTLQNFKNSVLSAQQSKQVKGGFATGPTGNGIHLPPHIDPNDLEAVREWLKNLGWEGSGPGGGGILP